MRHLCTTSAAASGNSSQKKCTFVSSVTRACAAFVCMKMKSRLFIADSASTLFRLWRRLRTRTSAAGTWSVHFAFRSYKFRYQLDARSSTITFAISVNGTLLLSTLRPRVLTPCCKNSRFIRASSCYLRNKICLTSC
jgi:hypothetical protein